MFTGSIVAIITPMNQKGDICQLSFKKLIDYHIANGTSAIVAIGSTGEYATLSHNEHIKVVMLALELANGRIPIIAGIGANTTAKAIKLMQYFNNSGIVGYLIMNPQDNKPTQGKILQHFKKISEYTDLPQIVYNVPSRTGCDILPETVSHLAKLDNIIGIKEATGNLNRVIQIKKIVSDSFILLSGDDFSALDFIQLGGHGVISVTANVAARDMAQMCKLAAAGYFDKARIINQRLMQLHDKLFIEPNPIPVKWACNKLGLTTTAISRLSITQITDYTREAVTAALKYAGLL